MESQSIELVSISIENKARIVLNSQLREITLDKLCCKSEMVQSLSLFKISQYEAVEMIARVHITTGKNLPLSLRKGSSDLPSSQYTQDLSILEKGYLS